MAEVNQSNLYEINTGILPRDACVVIVNTEWNHKIVNELTEGCNRILKQYGTSCIKTLTVPGAFEIPFIIKNYWEANKYKDDKPNVFIALGTVIKGGTPHFEYVCKAVTDGIVQLNLSLPVPSVFGILTVDNQQQALDRVGGKDGHKGEEAALTALKMLTLMASYKK